MTVIKDVDVIARCICSVSKCLCIGVGILCTAIPRAVQSFETAPSAMTREVCTPPLMLTAPAMFILGFKSFTQLILNC